MKISRNRVVIVGAGSVGTTIAYSLVVQEVCAEIVLVDINEQKAIGEAMDIQHGIEYFGRNTKIKAGSYADCKDAEIVVITASAPYSGEQNRLLMQDKSAAIVKAIVPQIMASGFDGIFVVVSNPVDIISYLVYKLSGLPKNQIIGTGTAIETARLKQYVGHLMDIDPRNVEALVLGEHGESLFVPWSLARASGKKLMDIIKDNPEYNDLDLAQIEDLTRKAGFDVLGKKGNTQYGIASVATGIISAILRDEYKAIPVSTLLEGEYGVSEVFCGVPTILNRHGALDIVELHMTESENESFLKSVNVIKENIKKLGLQNE
jgi:L-lactate dehydrogenase